VASGLLLLDGKGHRLALRPLEADGLVVDLRQKARRLDLNEDLGVERGAAARRENPEARVGERRARQGLGVRRERDQREQKLHQHGSAHLQTLIMQWISSRLRTDLGTLDSLTSGTHRGKRPRSLRLTVLRRLTPPSCQG